MAHHLIKIIVFRLNLREKENEDWKVDGHE